MRDVYTVNEIYHDKLVIDAVQVLKYTNRANSQPAGSLVCKLSGENTINLFWQSICFGIVKISLVTELYVTYMLKVIINS